MRTKASKTERINKELIHLAQLGDNTAINKLLVNNEPAIRNFLLKRLRDKRNDIDDLVNETMMKISSGLYAYDHIRPFTSYVFQLSKQVLIDYFRDKKAEVKLVGEPDSENMFTVCLDESFIQKENFVNLQDRIKKIISEFKNDEMKQVLLMSLFEQLTNKEISDRIGLTEGFVKTHLSRGKKIIRENLGNRILPTI